MPPKMVQNSSEKWEAKVVARLETTEADQIWPFFKDFFNIHEYFTSLRTSYGVHGTNGKPGGIRYCAGSSFPPSNNADNKTNRDGEKAGEHPTISWCKERLIAIDDGEKTLSYEILESNIGFKSYVSTIRVESIGKDGQQYGAAGCVVEWWFSVDPVQGLKFEDLVEKYEVGLKNMVGRMVDAASNAIN